MVKLLSLIIDPITHILERFFFQSDSVREFRELHEFFGFTNIAVWPFVIDHRGFRMEFSSNVGAVNCKLNAPEAQLFFEPKNNGGMVKGSICFLRISWGR